MQIIAFGINYRKAPVHIREKFTIADQDMPQALTALRRAEGMMECVMIGTCNRTEIYAVVDQPSSSRQHIDEFMEQWFGISRDIFAPYLYFYEDREAVRHLFRVTSGLDSMVIGETQILGQMRNAFLLAQRERATGTLFNSLFKQAVTLAKRAHSETAIGENPVSVSYAAVELGKRIFGSFAGKTVMIMGAGKMSELTVKYLHTNGVGKVIVANRTLAAAQELANKFNGVACDLEQSVSYLAETDIVISSTGASSYVLRADQVEAAMRKRKSRPLFMMDIAVPRDLDPEISALSNVFLYDIDDMEMIVDSNLQERKKEAVKIEGIIEGEMESFEQWLKTLGVTPVIQALQTKANAIHEETMRDLMNRLPELNEREIKLIQKLSKSMINQMVREPILRVKEMSAERDRDKAIEMFTRMFALEHVLEERSQASKVRETVAKKRVREKKQEDDRVSIGLQARLLPGDT